MVTGIRGSRAGLRTHGSIADEREASAGTCGSGLVRPSSGHCNGSKRASIVKVVAIIALGGLAAPLPAQTLLDKLVARVGRPRTMQTAAVPDPQAPASVATAGRHRPVTEFDVAGIWLRATPAEVRAAMVRAGYRITYTGDTASFEQQVAAEAAQRRGVRPPDTRAAGTNNMIATGPHQENLIVEFMQAPTGSQASNVSLRVPEEAMTGDALRRQLLDKYGRPDSSRSGGSELHWCSPETVANCGMTIATSGPLDDQQPLLSAAVNPYGGGGSLRLQIGETAFPRLAAEKEAAVERLVPKTNRAAF